MPLVFASVALGALLPLVVAYDNAATVYGQTGRCFSACNDCFRNLTPGDIPPETTDFTKSHAYMTSIVKCLDTYCGTSQAVDEGFQKLVHYYVEYEEAAEAEIEPIEHWRSNTNASVVTIDVTDPHVADVPFNSTIMPTMKNFKNAYLTEEVWDTTVSYDHAFGWALYILLGFMLIFGMLSRFIAYLSSRRSLRGHVEDLNLGRIPNTTSFKSRAHTWWRKHVSVPALFGYRHMQPWGWMTLPTRLQGMILAIYICLNFIWSFTNYRLFDENFYWPNQKNIQLGRYVADRTGIMSFYNLPLLWVMAGRNDVLLWVTGWSYQSMNMFHRWIARMATIQAIVHSCCYTYVVWGPRFAEDWKERYWWTGVIATICMSLLLPLSLAPVRIKVYEFFLMAHIVLALVTLVTLMYHVEVFEHQYDGWIWACIAIWLFDRVLRVARLGALSFRTFKKGGTNTVARMTGGDTCLVRLTVRTSMTINPKPGSYYFLYTPRSYTPWENHPFTLASWETPEEGPGTLLHFLLAPRNGATGRLRRRIQRFNDNAARVTDAHMAAAAPMRVLPEGPYGHTHNVGMYEHVLLIAGGSGITAILPYLFDLRENKRVRQIDVVWVVRHADYAADVLSTELAPKMTAHANIRLFVSAEQGAHPEDVLDALPDTVEASLGKCPHWAAERADCTEKPPPAEKASSTSGESGGSSQARGFGYGHKIIGGRPRMQNLVRASLDKLEGAERLAVLGCGPPGMMDDLRQAVANSYGSGVGQVRAGALEYFEDAFEW